MFQAMYSASDKDFAEYHTYVVSSSLPSRISKAKLSRQKNFEDALVYSFLVSGQNRKTAGVS